MEQTHHGLCFKRFAVLVREAGKVIVSFKTGARGRKKVKDSGGGVDIARSDDKSKNRQQNLNGEDRVETIRSTDDKTSSTKSQGNGEQGTLKETQVVKFA